MQTFQDWNDDGMGDFVELVRTARDRRLVALHNLTAEGCTVPVTLEGYGYRWLRLASRSSRRIR